MKRIVLGTAGHIDHGKTLLTKALTGVDTDRLAEEKARGITIELGFAPMQLPDGTQVSLVDVPGHEKFVRTMICGVSGIDAVLLVIAADDGVMPQTREHLDILKLLGLRQGLVVLTKCDLVTPERVQEVILQTAELVQGTFLENAPVFPVSAVTGEGMDALKAGIEALVAGACERSTLQPFRLCTDRVFPVEGFGQVVSGTVTEGCAEVGSSVVLSPGERTAVLRTVQTHGEARPQAQAGQRAALSFSALNGGAPERGCTVAEPDSLLMTDCITADIQILPDCPYLIRNSSQLHLYHGTSELVCKLRLLDADALRPGESGFAQLQLARPIPVRWDDRFLLRFFSPVVTVGGGTVLAVSDARLRRKQPPVLERLQRLQDARLEVRLAQRILDGGLIPTDPGRLRRCSNLSEAQFQKALEALHAAGAVRQLPDGRLVSEAALSEKLDEGRSRLRAFHEEYALMQGMPLAQWRSTLFAQREVPADELLKLWCSEGSLKTENGFVALPEFTPVFTQAHKIMQRKLLHHYREAWLLAPDLAEVKEKFQRFELFEEVLRNMRMNGMLIPLSSRYWVHFEALEDAQRIFIGLSRESPAVTLAQFRTAAGISRKYSQLFLEYWDRRGFTRRVGDAHELCSSSQKTDA